MDKKSHATILVVDDDQDVLKCTSVLLTEFGYSVVPCSGASDGLARLQKVKIDAVLTDIVMPRMTGIELLEKIHAMDPEIPVVLMTAYADMDKAVEAIKKGAFDFLIKPYDPKQLAHSIERAVKYNRLIQMEKDYKSILEDLNQALETLVAERTMSLMALTLADRVRNPATVIGWTCKKIIEKEELSLRLKEGLTDIIFEAEKLEKIVQDFQNILKSKQSMFGYEDINVILDTVVSVIGKEAVYHGVKLEFSPSDQPLKINMHKNLLRVAIFNVLRNAVEATPQGGTVAVTVSEEGDKAVLTISDTGTGIPPELIDKIFDPLFSTKEQRFGMGLPLVKQIVSEHAGEINVESVKGKGTTFRMVFPVRWLGNSELPD